MCKLLRILENDSSRENFIDGICNGIINVSEFRDQIYILINKIKQDEDLLIKNYYEEEEYLIDLIMPAFRRAWSIVYINIPDIINTVDRKMLYQSIFNTTDFYNYLIKTFEETENCLANFNNIDKSVQHLTLILDDYQGYLVDKVLSCNDIQSEIRKNRINKVLNNENNNIL